MVSVGITFILLPDASVCIEGGNSNCIGLFLKRNPHPLKIILAIWYFFI